MKNFFSIILSFIVIIILLYTSFLIKSWIGYEKPNFELKNWNFSFDILDWKISKKENWNTKVEYINFDDKILTNNSKYSINNSTINLEKWIFLLNLNSIDKKYLLKSVWFEVEIESPASIFIDNTGKTTKIVSLDNIVKLSFLDIKTNENLNYAFLYPNEYVIFDPNKNFLIKNADLLRITQLLSLWYFNESIIINEKINPTFKKSFFGKDRDISKETEKLFLFVNSDFKEKEKNVENFLKKEFFKDSWNDLIEQYPFLLLNKKKEAISEKNIILVALKDILSDTKKFNQKKDLIKENFEKLKNQNQNDFKEIENIIKYFSVYVNSNRKNRNELKIFLSKILNENFSMIAKSENIDLNYNFFRFNFIKNENFYSEIKEFIKEKSNQKIDSKEQNYFVFFLNKLIFANLKDKNINFADIINIFKNYSKIWIKYYSVEDLNDEILKQKIIETWIVNFEDIIREFLIKLESNYFTKNSNWLLIPINWKNLDKNSINDFSSAIKNIYEDFYEVNKSKITSSYIKRNYEKNYKKFEELELALSDFQKYSINYDSKNSIFLDSKNEEEENNVKIENAKKYLEKFNWLKFSESNIEVMWEKFCQNPKNKVFAKIKANPTCYKISDITAWNNVNLSFILYPNNFNEISNIEIWWNPNINKWTYKLDIIEDEYGGFWDKNWEWNSWNEITFEDFFINNIISSWNLSENKVEIIEDKEVIEESTLIRTLKNTALLWSNWTLSKLKNVSVKYNDLKVKETNDWKEYIINVEWAEVNFKTKNINYKWKLNSSYKYKAWKTNSFFNPEIIFSNEQWNDPILWEKLKISGFIDLSKFDSIIIKIWEKIDNISKIVKIIKIRENTEMNIVYFPNTDKFQISSKNIKVYTNWDEIENVISFWKKILEKNIKMDKIDTLFDN